MYAALGIGIHCSFGSARVWVSCHPVPVRRCASMMSGQRDGGLKVKMACLQGQDQLLREARGRLPEGRSHGWAGQRRHAHPLLRR